MGASARLPGHVYVQLFPYNSCLHSDGSFFQRLDYFESRPRANDYADFGPVLASWPNQPRNGREVGAWVGVATRGDPVGRRRPETSCRYIMDLDELPIWQSPGIDASDLAIASASSSFAFVQPLNDWKRPNFCLCCFGINSPGHAHSLDRRLFCFECPFGAGRLSRNRKTRRWQTCAHDGGMEY